MPFEPIQSPRLYQQVASRLAEMIAGGELKAGERLPAEPELARRFAVSRGAIREAMIALETGGMIEVRHGNGAYVREDSAHGTDIDWNRGSSADPGPFEQFEMREILEPEAAARAALRIADAQIDELEAMLNRMKARVHDTGSQRDGRTFMERIAAASGNSILQSMIEELWRLRDGRMWTTLRMRILGPQQRAAAILRREAIIAALRARDPEAARQVTRDYLTLTKRIYFGDLVGAADDGG